MVPVVVVPVVVVPVAVEETPPRKLMLKNNRPLAREAPVVPVAVVPVAVVPAAVVPAAVTAMREPLGKPTRGWQVIWLH